MTAPEDYDRATLIALLQDWYSFATQAGVLADIAYKTRPILEREYARDRSANHLPGPPQGVQVTAEARRLLAAEDARQDKLHELLETIREQIRLDVAPEHRPEGLFKNIQDAVYAMRGRTRLMNDAAILVALGACICQDQHRRGYCTEPGCPYSMALSTEIR